MTWQYNGVAPWHTIIAWCYEHLNKGDWGSNMTDTIWFLNEPAYTMFVLRWA